MDEPIIIEDDRRYGFFFFIANGFLLILFILISVIQPEGYPFAVFIITCFACCTINGLIKDNRRRFVNFTKSEIVLSRPRWFGRRNRKIAPIEGLKAIEARTDIVFDIDTRSRRYQRSFIFMYEDKTIRWSSYHLFNFNTETVFKIRDQLREIAKSNNLVFVTRSSPDYHLRYHSKMKEVKKIENFRKD